MKQITGLSLSLAMLAAMSFSSQPAQAQMTLNNGVPYLLSQSLDISQQFSDPTNTYFFADSLVSFNPETGRGTLQWSRNELHPRQAFNANGYWQKPLQNLDFPEPAYDQSPTLEFAILPVNERTLRLRIYTSPIVPQDPADDVMLVAEPSIDFAAWKVQKTGYGDRKSVV